MFAIPLIAPLHETLTSHVFGRFLSRSSVSVAGSDAALPSVGAVAGDLAMDDGLPDLAQRVRETGEW
ncbi:hypothetical protein [Acidovorax sp. sic0104]|uniref:hypothetical protein n=1 Tax=Acidovorax sp. sic0104 TaxID=2854784 RepID=UPI001C447AFF|nr:hypothetical protein [Acidovorax sp. sic0104]MBV7540527.1 hypothetical protein [Acidovorax sp. sic0104]